MNKSKMVKIWGFSSNFAYCANGWDLNDSIRKEEFQPVTIMSDTHTDSGYMLKKIKKNDTLFWQ